VIRWQAASTKRSWSATSGDPEIRTTQDGTRIAHLAVATSGTWRDRVSGERRERAEWHRVVIFNEPLA
jgi:single-strand DNA-binding protein